MAALRNGLPRKNRFGERKKAFDTDFKGTVSAVIHLASIGLGFTET